MALTLGQIAGRLGGHLSGGETIQPRGLSLDSRQVREGELFCAIRGEHADGHRFIAQAARKGACGALVEETSAEVPAGFPLLIVPSVPEAMLEIAKAIRGTFHGPVVAITGTVGKTTTKEMAALLLAGQGPILKSEGNWNTELGFPLALSHLRSEHRIMVLELGLQKPGDVRLLAGILQPDVGVITEIGPAHLEFLGNVEQILEEKWELIRALAPAGVAILNKDHASLQRKGLLRERSLWFGLQESADFHPISRYDDGERTMLLARTPSGDQLFELPFVGDLWIRDFLAALAIALSLGVSLEEAAARIVEFRPAPGRGGILEREGVYWVDDSYNANPTSMQASLESFLRRRRGRAILVLGDMLELGAESEVFHKQLGRKIPHDVEHLFLFGHFSASLVEGALESGFPAERIHLYSSYQTLRNALRSTLRPGDWVLLKGSRGVHLETILEKTE